jgi:hypothetical protein
LSLGTASSTAVVIGNSGIPVTIPGALTLGSASSTGQLIFRNASTSFSTILQASSSQASNLTFTLPTTAGTAGQAILTDGAGTFFFGNPSLSQWLNGTSGTISYSSGSIGINTTTPTSLFSIVGSSTSPASLFNIASSSGASLFNVSSNGNVTVGSTVPSGAPSSSLAAAGNIYAGDPTTPKQLATLNAAVNAQTGTSYTLTSADNGKVLTFNNASGTVLTVPSGLGAGFNCLIAQLGAGTVTPTSSATTIYQRQSLTQTAGQYGVATLVAISPNTFILSGDLQ